MVMRKKIIIKYYNAKGIINKSVYILIETEICLLISYLLNSFYTNNRKPTHLPVTL